MKFVDRFILHLSLISDVGIETIKRLVILLDQYSIEEIYNFSIIQLQKATSFSNKKAAAIVDGLQNIKILEKEEYLIQKSGVSYISFCNKNYPKLLSEIDSPPPVLYYKGKDFVDYQNQLMVAAVGSRQGNHYGQQVINQFIPEFVKHKICIVSGGAFGIDAMTHKTTLLSKGNTIAVLGSGFLHPYPYQHKLLFDTIVQSQGTLVSCFSMDTKPLPHNFPARNRIISGLASATIIIQAAEKSGAYITAQCALEQGRDVFAVPGNIFDPLSVGCHALLNQGARLANSAETILKSLIPQSTSFIPQQMPTKELVLIEKNIYLKQEETITTKILQICKNPTFFEELTEIIDSIDIGTLQKAVCHLQLQGKLKQDVSGAFVMVKL